MDNVERVLAERNVMGRHQAILTLTVNSAPDMPTFPLLTLIFPSLNTTVSAVAPLAVTVYVPELENCSEPPFAGRFTVPSGVWTVAATDPLLVMVK